MRTFRAVVVVSLALLATACGDSGKERQEPPERPSRDDMPLAHTTTPRTTEDGVVASPPDSDHPTDRPRSRASSPLAERLPLTIGSATVSLAGPTADGRRSRVVVTAPDRSRAELERLYADLLEATGDDGRLLEPVFVGADS